MATENEVLENQLVDNENAANELNGELPGKGKKGKYSFRKITRSEFGSKIITKRLALIFAVLLIVGSILSYLRTSVSDESYNNFLDFLLTFTQPEFLGFVLIGFIAQIIDGALGMAYGASSQSMLGAAGVNPSLGIQAIKISEVFTTAASGFSHWKMGNINKKLVKNLIIPGVIGSALGSLTLVYLSSLEKFSKLYLKPAISFYVLLLGLYLIYKATRHIKRRKTSKLTPLAMFGGFMDAIGGGGWGPIVTSTLLSKGRNPRYTIGSVNLSEFFIALVGAITLTWAVGLTGWQIVVGMILGGVIAAPFGAIVAGKVKTKPLMVLVGSLIIIVNVYQLTKSYKAIKEEFSDKKKTTTEVKK